VNGDVPATERFPWRRAAVVRVIRTQSYGFDLRTMPAL
jgi:hypothetical protein